MKKLKKILKKNGGRAASGRITVRHQGGRSKRFLRNLDFARDKKDVWGVVKAIEYDPNRNANIALVLYEDGERRYILEPEGMEVGARIIAADTAGITPGNALPVGKIPVGSPIHNIEITPGKGGQLVRSAGQVAVIQGREDKYVLVKLPSGEIRRFLPEVCATIGKVGRAEYRTIIFRKAGRKRNMGIRPTVRGVAQHPNAHPHGGGEGRSGIGMKFPKTVYGRKAVGKTRNKKKYSNNMIVSPRKPGSHSN